MQAKYGAQDDSQKVMRATHCCRFVISRHRQRLPADEHGGMEPGYDQRPIRLLADRVRLRFQLLG